MVVLRLVDVRCFQIIQNLLMIVRVLPIHSTEVERTASEIRRLKTACCSTIFEDHKSDIRNFNLLCANFRNITVS